VIPSSARIDAEAGRARSDRLRPELLCVPARIVHHARGTVIRLSPGRDTLLPAVLARLRTLPAGP
jgi:hypothetical protein